MKQNSKQVLSSVEVALGSMIMCGQRVPTNTTDIWYQDLRSLGTELCSFEFHQSTDGRWIRIMLKFKARIVTQEPEEPRLSVRYSVLNIDSPEVLNRYDDLRRLTIYVTERVPWVRMPKDYKPLFGKELEFTFSRPTLTEEYDKVRENLKQLLVDIDNEADLILEDNLAKGRLIHLIRLSARKQENKERTWWSVDIKGLRCPVQSHHPTEYWGSISLTGEDLISESDAFPWMPTSICPGEPF